MPGATIDEWFVREIVHPNPGFHPFNVLKVRGASNAARECCWPPNTSDAKLIANAPADLSRMLAAVESVIELHKPDAGHNPLCECGIPAGAGASCEECQDVWPCPTITALAAALGSDTTNQEGTR
jgi:hypothetical protein